MAATVLVIDDDADNQSLLRQLLTQAGILVHTAANAYEAWAILADQSVDLITVDLRLPGVDGLTLCGQLRADPKTAATPIVVVSAFAHRRSIEAAYAAGADNYVVKPFTRDELLAAVEGAAGSARIHAAHPATTPVVRSPR